MKINWNTKYTTIAIYTFIIAASSIIFYLVSSQIDVFSNNLDAIFTTLQPFIIGFAIAYLLNFILKFYEDRIFIKSEKLKKLKQSSKRGLGLLLTYATATLILYLFMHFVLPQVIESIVGLANDIPMYVNNATKLIDKLMTDLNLDEQYFNLAVDKWNEFVTYIIKFVTDLIPILGSMLKNVASSIWNIVLGLIVSVYLLIDKEKFYGLSKKITYAVFTEKQAARILELTHSNYTFGRFLGGKILDSFIIGILTFVILTLVKMPYTLLISVIIGITNIIPFFGPLFGAIPSTLIVMFVSPIKAFWLLLIILIIQQIDGNIIGPKILGDSIGISAFWILFSLLVAGKLLGFIGMVIGVPMFAVIYSIIKDIVESKLDKKGLPTDTSDYM